MTRDTFRTHSGRTLQQAASDLVAREVLCCMSSMVSTLAAPWDLDHCNEVMDDLHAQAQELAAPVGDYDEAAIQAGWEWCGKTESWTHAASEDYYADARDLCDCERIEAHELEVYEHWAVSTWLAEKLQAAGERVDTDFAGLNVWARTTTGQAISIDAVIERVTREMHAV